MAAESAPSASSEPKRQMEGRSSMLWPAGDSLRLLYLLEARGSVPILATCRAMRRQFGQLVGLLRQALADPGTSAAAETHEAMLDLELILAEASDALTAPATGGLAAAPSTLQSAMAELADLESSLHTEMRYVYGPDWDLKPGKLISKKGTWLKKNTRFSWDALDADKLYMPHGVVMPVLQIGRVTDAEELKRHEWSNQHSRVWLKPPIIQAVEARRGVWFIFSPHWEVQGNVIVANTDTWLKRSCQMSGELQPFELIYVPKDLPVRLTRPPEVVDEQWEKFRHPHVYQHRMVTLPSKPLTVKQDKYDIFVGQSEK